MLCQEYKREVPWSEKEKLCKGITFNESNLRQVKAWVERLKGPRTENAKILFNDTEGSK